MGRGGGRGRLTLTNTTRAITDRHPPRTPHHHQAPWGRHGCLSGDGCKELPTPTPVDLMGQVESYISYILAHQAADGWLGPPSSGGGQYWAPSNVLQALWP